MRGCGAGAGALSAMSESVRQVPAGARVLFVGSALLALAALARRLAPWLVALFARIGRDDVLDHPTRAAALAHVRARPGIRTGELAAALGGANPGTLEHHLRTLARAGLVKPLLAGRERAWFPADVRPAIAASEAQSRVLDAVRARPGMTQREAADALGLAPSTVSHHVRALAGEVEARPDGRTKRLFSLRPHEDL